MAGHAQLKFVMTECSKTQIRLTGPKCTCYSSYMILWDIYWTARLLKELKCRICHKYFENNEFFRTSERPSPKKICYCEFLQCQKWLQTLKSNMGTTWVRKMQNIQQDFVLHAFKSDDALRNELSWHPLHARNHYWDTSWLGYLTYTYTWRLQPTRYLQQKLTARYKLK